MTNIYILSKSYHDFMFVFCSLFIGRQKKNNIKMWLLCTRINTYTQSHTYTHTQKDALTLNTRHEYSTR